jgi:hypothetical protein
MPRGMIAGLRLDITAAYTFLQGSTIVWCNVACIPIFMTPLLTTHLPLTQIIALSQEANVVRSPFNKLDIKRTIASAFCKQQNVMNSYLDYCIL